MIQERKPIKTYNQMISAYEASCDKISNQYNQEIGKLTEDSVKALYCLFHSYLTQKKAIQAACQITQNKSLIDAKTIPIAPTYIYEQNSNDVQQSARKSRNKENMNKENIVLSKQATKNSLRNNLLLMEDEEEEGEDSRTTKYTDVQEMKRKNLAQIIMQSQRKVQQKIDQKKEEFANENQDSDYQLTDYSSNQSSNEGNYEAHYAQQVSNKPLFGGLFGKTMSSQSINSNSSSNLLTFNFASKQLLKSPKKAPKSRRLYIGSKKIPKWAEDLCQIEKEQVKQEVNPNSIYGKCVVENLDTNVIFHDHREGINRTSSAKWDSQLFLT